MNLWLRCIWVYLTHFFRSRLEVLEPSVLKLRVLPNDLDLYWHMNNGRYLTVMDLGRLDLILRTGLHRVAVKKKWNPIVASSFVRYRKPLHFLEDFELHTRILGWDRKWFFLEQKFVRKGRVYARGLVKGLLVNPRGGVPVERVFRVLGIRVPSPPLPESLRMWIKSEDTAPARN